MSVETHSSAERPFWLFSRRADFWLACGGAPVGLLASILLIALYGDRELDALDFVLSEFHLGATYDAVIRRRLWRHRQFDVVLIPLVGYTHLVPTEYDGEPYLALNFGAEITSIVGLAAALWVIAYLAWTLRRNSGVRLNHTSENLGSQVHPGEWWVVLAHAVALGSGYALGASNASFLLVLAVHHEVQYLYFTYAMARRPGSFYAVSKTGTDPAMKDPESKDSYNAGRVLQTEIKFATSFLRWPVIGFAGAIVGSWAQLEWLAPLGWAGSCATTGSMVGFGRGEVRG
jgi:hypothetical protein